MPRPLPSSLTGRLVVTAVSLVALVSLLIAAATTVAIRSYLMGQLDTEVEQSAARAIRAHSEGRSFPRPPHDEPASGLSKIDPAFGQGSGTVTVYIGADGGTSGRNTHDDGHSDGDDDDDYTGGEVITSTGGLRPLSTGALNILRGVPVNREPHTVALPELGDYRVIATDNDDATVVTGLPIGGVDRTLSSLIRWEAMFGLLGVLVAGGAALFLVRRQLRPLREVARTAHEVSRLPLSEGEIGMTARVPDRLTDERTEVGRVGAALNTLLGHVERALDSRHHSEQQVRQFVADASHELRTPLATIQGYAELSRRTSTADAQRLMHAMGKVEAESSRMSSLVEDLLLLARLDAGRPLDRSKVDLTKMVLESVGDAHVVAPGHHWVLDLTDDPVVVTGDEQRLHQVISNVLGNARRHTPEGTTVTVGVHPSEDGTAAVVTVHDDGPGIPADLQDSLFERFSRGDSARTRASGGVGLGLSLVRAIIDAHGGTIGVTSRPGSTCFTLTLPV